MSSLSAAASSGRRSHGASSITAIVSVVDEGDARFVLVELGWFGAIKGDGLSEYARWIRRSADLWTDFSEGAKAHIAHTKPGLYSTLTEKTIASVISTRDAGSRRGGRGAEMLDRQQLDEMLPDLAPTDLGLPDDGHNPLLCAPCPRHSEARRTYHADAGVRQVTRTVGFHITTAAEAIERSRYAGHGNDARADVAWMCRSTRKRGRSW